jgi:hypothetical protein
MDVEMGEADPLSSQRDLKTVVWAGPLPSEDLEMEEAGPSSSQDPPPTVGKAGPSPPMPFDAGSSKATRVIVCSQLRFSD